MATGTRTCTWPTSGTARTSGGLSPKWTRTSEFVHRTIDLEHLDLGSEQYDVVVCVNVLEHVRDPLTVFPAVWQALRHGGLFVLEVPNVVSLKGVVTRVMPWRFQRWMYARIFG
jgi:2-polyprenyl-3-methyl-5-hydroxy-6-metoxy-1,4-benzoquinol methylase